MDNRTRRSNRSTALSLAAFAAGMVMLAYASVPLYRLFCQVTGFAGTPRQGAYAGPVQTDRVITVRFNADIDPALPWEFKPTQPSLPVRVGESALAFYTVANRAATPVSGHATYNVVPEKAAPYFVKVDCFCFKDQRLLAGQVADMPVSFYLDPALIDDPLMKDVRTITLSYTFFAAKNAPSTPNTPERNN